jgi:hypothetical protein
MLCEQLARELAAGAEPGSVVADGTTQLASAEVLVHVMAAEPSEADEAIVRAADLEGVPVVLVQLWPQDNWMPPFVLTPFVVECRAGQGFPVPEIANRIAEAAEHAVGLARRVPAVHDAVASRVVATSTVRSALIPLTARKSPSRQMLALEEVRTLAQLRSLEAAAVPKELPIAAGVAAGAMGVSYGVREVARRARIGIPVPAVEAALAAATTWALAQVALRLDRSEA